MTGYGGVIRDEKGFIKAIFCSHLGKATNNMAELMALKQCLEILRDSNLHNTIIETNFELIIHLVKKICYGSTPDKVSRHWRLLQVYQRIQSHPQNMKTPSFTHVHLTTNKLVDILANEGILCAKRNKIYDWKGTHQGRLKEVCLRQVNMDREFYQSRGSQRMQTKGNKGFLIFMVKQSMETGRQDIQSSGGNLYPELYKPKVIGWE